MNSPPLRDIVVLLESERFDDETFGNDAEDELALALHGNPVSITQNSSRILGQMWLLTTGPLASFHRALRRACLLT